MRSNSRPAWPARLQNPGGQRITPLEPENKHDADRTVGRGQTMIIDKGLGQNGFSDLLETAGAYITCVKIGFGTAPLYPTELLLGKIELAKRHGILIMPGGTLLEAAVSQELVPAFFETICRLGFNGVEVSDGTIELSRSRRSELIREGLNHGLQVVTEYGKKLNGSTVDIAELQATADADWYAGAELITIEARESGVGVGLFDENGDCKEDVLLAVERSFGGISRIMWETPLKQQQALLLRTFGPEAHLGNIPPQDALSLETMRRGLRSDTFSFGLKNELPIHYMI